MSPLPRIPRLLRVLPRRLVGAVQALGSRFYGRAFSVLSVRSDMSGWVLHEEARAIERCARALGIRAGVDLGLSRRAGQCLHYTSQFALLQPRLLETSNRVSVDYFHGLPGTGREFDALFAAVRRAREDLWRVRVSHSQMEAVALDAGVPRERVIRIPIGVDLELLPVQTGASKAASRLRLGLPADSPVVGSFQKDGVGWGAGDEPKGIKGPDVLVEALRLLASRVPGLWVLLVGPARGYVKRRLAEAGIPFRHHVFRSYAEAAACYQALDAYVIASRQEGGPKSVLEAMATGVPVVSTRVGQAMDLVAHERNGFLVDVEDSEGLAHFSERALMQDEARSALVREGRSTAESNAYPSQLPLWRDFFAGFVAGA